jgi:hypothetical protein
MTGLVIVCTVLGFTMIAKGALWLADRGMEDGDQPADAHSSIGIGPDQDLLVEVVNPSETAVVVGCHVRRRLTPERLQGAVPSLVNRPATRSERRRPDRGASGMLGVVEPGSARRWAIPSDGGPSRCLVFLGQPGGRLRVHDHAVPYAASSSP